MSSVTAQIWITFLLNILKDVLWQFIIKNPIFKKVWLYLKRKYLLRTLTYRHFLRQYKSFIREKNEIFSLMMSDYRNKTPEDPVFFFSALTQYWSLKRNLIQQYEKNLSVFLIDDNYDIFEDEIKQEKTYKTKNSIKKLVWRINEIDEKFESEFITCKKNLDYLRNFAWSANNFRDFYNYDSVNIGKLSNAEIEIHIKNYVKDTEKLVSNWKSRNNKIRTIEKFELYTDTKIIQKYATVLNVQIDYKDSNNLIKITNVLNNTFKKMSDATGEKNKSLKRKFKRAEKKYVKTYYKLLMEKYVIVEKKKSKEELSSSDAALILERSSYYLNEVNKLLEDARSMALSKDAKWKIAYRLWEINEIRKNICSAYLGIDGDFSRWASSFEKIVALATKSNSTISTLQGWSGEAMTTRIKRAESFLRTEIKPTEVFAVHAEQN